MLPSGSPRASARITRLVPPWAMTAIAAARVPLDDSAGTAGTARAPEIGQALALRKRHREGVGEPAVAQLRLPRADLRERETLPAPHGHLAERRHGDHAPSPGPRPAAPPTAGRGGGRSHRRPRSAPPEALPERGRLREARGRQGDVRVPEEAAFRRVEHLAVAGEVHPRRRHQASSRKSRLTARVRTPASVVSTSAPSVSPVNPPSRRRR